MATPSPRRSPDRRGAVLEAALACFARQGLEATTIEDIRRASGASVGSLYHHFGSKEGIAAAVYLEGLRAFHASLRPRVEAAEDAEVLVKAIVHHYVEWVVAHPEWARFLLEARRTQAVAEADPEIHALTREAFARLEPFVRRGALSKLATPLLAAILLGPAQALAGAELRRGRPAALRAAAPVLAEAAWRALRAPL
jgi:AcrR family transcriptional regulator